MIRDLLHSSSCVRQQTKELGFVDKRPSRRVKGKERHVTCVKYERNHRSVLEAFGWPRYSSPCRAMLCDFVSQPMQ